MCPMHVELQLGDWLVFLGQEMRPKNRAREALGDRAASQGGLLSALLNELFVFG